MSTQLSMPGDGIRWPRALGDAHRPLFSDVVWHPDPFHGTELGSRLGSRIRVLSRYRDQRADGQWARGVWAALCPKRRGR
jgi:hypothetical protein